MTGTKSWNPLTLKCEKIDYSPILLTDQQYISQLKIGSDEWFKTDETKTGRIVLVENSIKWTLVYKSDDCAFVKLQRGQKTIKVSAQDFVAQYSFDFKA